MNAKQRKAIQRKAILMAGLVALGNIAPKIIKLREEKLLKQRLQEEEHRKFIKTHKVMITKEQSAAIFNLYSQIETCDQLINDLQKFIQECDGRVPDIIDESYRHYGSIEICVPYFEKGRFKNDGARVFNVNYSIALKVIKSHRRMLKKRLEKLQNQILVEWPKK